MHPAKFSRAGAGDRVAVLCSDEVLCDAGEIDEIISAQANQSGTRTPTE